MIEFIVFHAVGNCIYPWWNNFWRSLDFNGIIHIQYLIDKNLEIYNCKYDIDTAMISFETEEDMIKFILEWA